jgi:hypothetical protein
MKKIYLIRKKILYLEKKFSFVLEGKFAKKKIRLKEKNYYLIKKKIKKKKN